MKQQNLYKVEAKKKRDYLLTSGKKKRHYLILLFQTETYGKPYFRAVG